MLNSETMEAIEPESGYKYLGILEADGIKHKDIRKKKERGFVMIRFKDEWQKHNFNNKLACSFSGLACSRNSEVDRR